VEAGDVALLTVAGALGFYLARGLRPVQLGPQAGRGPSYAPTVREPGFYFTWSELTATDTGLPNEPSAGAAANLVDLVAYVLDPLRASLGEPVFVTSGYRSPQVNAAVGSTNDASQHTTGQAADIRANGLSSVELARAVVDAGLPYDQLIWYSSNRGGHVHVSYVGNQNRAETLFASDAGGYTPSAPSRGTA
jgi:zinc D-Ala-D-Ala carboxypeptidase